MRHLPALTLLALLPLLALDAHAADQQRSVAPFTSIKNTGALDVVVDVGQPQSITASGSQAQLDALQTEVVGGELRIRLRGKHDGPSNTWGTLHIAIGVPQLTRYDMAGAGETTLRHVSGDSLDIHFAGAGSLKGDGRVGRLTLQVGGVGSIELRELHADEARVNVGGVGSVDVWASQRLDASVGGVGSLTYYGHPKSVSTSGGGLGSISRGD